MYFLLAHNNTCSFVVSPVPFITVSSFIISAVIEWSLMLFINCSLCLLSISLYLHSMALALSLPIHCSPDSSDCIISLHYCSDNVISLQCGFNLLQSISNSPLTNQMLLALPLTEFLLTVVLPSLTLVY